MKTKVLFTCIAMSATLVACGGDSSSGNKGGNATAYDNGNCTQTFIDQYNQANSNPTPENCSLFLNTHGSSASCTARNTSTGTTIFADAATIADKCRYTTKPVEQKNYCSRSLLAKVVEWSDAIKAIADTVGGSQYIPRFYAACDDLKVDRYTECEIEGNGKTLKVSTLLDACEKFRSDIEKNN
jgi:hypothetical protein